MSKHVISISVGYCYHRCPFFHSSNEGMECIHPYWEDKGSYAGFIIDHDNSRFEAIPPKCPLREGEVEITTIYKLEKSL